MDLDQCNKKGIKPWKLQLDKKERSLTVTEESLAEIWDDKENDIWNEY